MTVYTCKVKKRLTITERFAKEGSKVIVADLFLESAQKVVDEIKAEGGEAVACKRGLLENSLLPAWMLSLSHYY
mgnify:CR=1 FL=1